MSYFPRTLPAQGDTTANALSVESMFAQILGAVQKSVRWRLSGSNNLVFNKGRHSKPRYPNFAKNAQT